MAILKLYNGSKSQLDSTAKEAGSIYILEDGSFWFDYLDANNAVQRKQIANDKDTIIKHVEYLPIEGDASCIYNVPNGVYGARQYISGGWSAIVNLQDVPIVPGAYNVSYAIPNTKYNQLYFGDCFLDLIDTDNVEQQYMNDNLN